MPIRLLVADGAAMQHDVVADRAVRCRSSAESPDRCAACSCPGSAALAELDPLVVAAQHRAEPDAGVALRAARGRSASRFRRSSSVRRPEIPAPVRRARRSACPLLVERPSHATPKFGRAPSGEQQPAGLQGHRPRPCRTSGSRSRRSSSPGTTNSKRRPSCGVPRSVLRMIRNGAANISSGTAAKAPALGPALSMAEARQPVGGELDRRRRKDPATAKPSASEQQHLHGIRRHRRASTHTNRPIPCKIAGRARQPILNK